jgi:hypothetical protein
MANISNDAMKTFRATVVDTGTDWLYVPGGKEFDVSVTLTDATVDIERRYALSEDANHDGVAKVIEQHSASVEKVLKNAMSCEVRLVVSTYGSGNVDLLIGIGNARSSA